MVLPLAVIGAMGVAGGLSTVHKGLQYAENRRYWREYEKNTGYRPRYPARTGYYDYLSLASSGISSAAMTYGSVHRWYYGN